MKKITSNICLYVPFEKDTQTFSHFLEEQTHKQQTNE